MKWIVKSLRATDDLFKDLLKSRNIIDFDKFITSSLSDFYDPFIIPMIQDAVSRIQKAIASKELIYIYGDFDVDGTAATAILWIYLKELGANVLPYIPNRVDEGYGMNLKTLTQLKNNGASLIISVDCGIRDIELVEQMKDQGVDIIITDHHEFVLKDNKPILPNTIVIHSLHPLSPYKWVLSGGATAWKLVCAIEKTLTGNPLSEKSLSLLEYATLTTITDIMPLMEENRVIVKMGIENLRKTQKIGLLKLIEVSGIEKNKIDEYHIGYILGPRLNAPGRVDNSAMDSLRLLCTTNDSQAMKLAIKVNDLNKIRQEWTAKYLEMGVSQVDLKQKVIFILGEDWPEGIVGLVAGKLAEKFGRPCLVATYNTKEDKVTGSARTYGDVNIVEMISWCSHYLTKFGGHKAAAGFSLKVVNVDKFKNLLFEKSHELISDELLEHKLKIDLEARPQEINLHLIQDIESLAPFGNSNLNPIFTLKNMKIIEYKKIGRNNEHLKIKILDEFDKNTFDALGFNYDKAPVLLGDLINIAFIPKKNIWNNVESIQLEIKDIIKLT